MPYFIGDYTLKKLSLYKNAKTIKRIHKLIFSSFFQVDICVVLEIQNGGQRSVEFFRMISFVAI
jgi:hypothetical protein